MMTMRIEASVKSKNRWNHLINWIKARTQFFIFFLFGWYYFSFLALANWATRGYVMILNPLPKLCTCQHSFNKQQIRLQTLTPQLNKGIQAIQPAKLSIQDKLHFQLLVGGKGSSFIIKKEIFHFHKKVIKIEPNIHIKDIKTRF